jgi:hypothetical protein
MKKKKTPSFHIWILFCQKHYYIMTMVFLFEEFIMADKESFSFKIGYYNGNYAFNYASDYSKTIIKMKSSYNPM